MAKQTILIDDISGETEGVETVTFSFEGNSYSIDLCAENRAVMTQTLKVYIDNATRTGSSAKASRKSADLPAKEIRAWAKSQPKEVSSLMKSDRGAIPKAVIAAYNESHGTNY